MQKYQGPRTATADEVTELDLPDGVQLEIAGLAGKMREGLLALSVSVGLEVMDELIAEELTALCGPRGKHDPERTASRHGSREASVVLGGRKVSARRPGRPAATKRRSAAGSCSHPRTCSASAASR